MTHRIYLRTPDQRVKDKTATDNRAVALAAFAALVERTDLDGKDILAVWNSDGKQVAHHSFLLTVDGQPRDPGKWWRGRVGELADK